MTNNPSRWRARNPKAIDDLAPRQGIETTKSAWAHTLPDDTQVAQLLGLCNANASSKLQAAAVITFEAHNNNRVRTAVNLVSVPRAVLPPDLVVQEITEHLVRRFDRTHRGLRTGTIEAQEQCRDTTFNTGAVRPYAREELIPLLTELLDRGCIRAVYQPAVRKVISESASRR